MARDMLLTVALDAQTGAVLWDRPAAEWIGNPTDQVALLVSPDGDRVYNTVSSWVDGRYQVVALDARTGTPQWRDRTVAYDHEAAAGAMGSDGTLYIVGIAERQFETILTVAYRG
jgi:outer membrane protein assembly factor BamB